MLEKGLETILKEQTLPAEPQTFVVVNDYTTFSCAYTKKPSTGEPDYHFHFFQTPESKKLGKNYWELAFATCLDAVAREFFGYEYPRLQASFIQGVIRSNDPRPLDQVEPEDSWWLIVQQMEVGAFPIGDSADDKIARFLEKLDHALEASMRT